MPNIVISGSLNIDRFALVTHFPRPGETITSLRTYTRFGGKGANQAMAAAGVGGTVSMIGAVGGDDAGKNYCQRLIQAGIDISGIVRKGPETETGSATILVDHSGENCIVAHPGANLQLTPDDIRAAQNLITTAGVLVLQLETPLETVLEAMRLASEAKVPVLFNPSPWRDDFPWEAVTLHTVVVNQTEASALLGGKPHFPEKLNIQRLVVTQGSAPTLGFTRTNQYSVAPPEVKPVDTVGAGDAFAGALALMLTEQQPFADALRFANAVGALATLHHGAQEARITRKEAAALSHKTTNL